MSSWAENRSSWQRGLGRANAFARCTSAALALVALFGVAELGDAVLGYPAFGASVRDLERATDLALLGFTAVAFLLWLSAAIRLSASLSATRIEWTSSKAVWAFVIPFLSLYRPYQVMRDLHDQLAPDGVPEPAPRPRMDGIGGYRSVAMEKAPPPRALPRAYIGAWWGLFMAERLLAGLPVLGNAIAVAAAGLAVYVVRALQGRLEERYRRVSYASDEELEAWKIPRVAAA